MEGDGRVATYALFVRSDFQNEISREPCVQITHIVFLASKLKLYPM